MSSIYKQKNSRQWWIKYRHPEKGVLRQSLKTTDKQVAKTIQRRFEQVEKTGRLPEVVTLDTLMVQWRDLSSVQSSSRQARSKYSVMRHFTQQVKITKPEQITKRAIERWVVHLQSTGLSPKTITGKIATISNFCRFLQSHDIIGHVPHVKAPKLSKLPPRHLNDTEITTCLTMAQEAGPDCYTAVLIALKTGVRLSELKRLNWEDFQWNQRLLVIGQTKSRRPRTVPLNQALIDHLQPLSQPKGPVFSAPPNKHGSRHHGTVWFARLLKPIQAAMPIFTEGMGATATGRGWHLFRHTFGTNLAKNGVPLTKIKEWMGHSSINTTMIYAAYAPHRYDSDIEKA